jgi:hypothetical protein
MIRRIPKKKRVEKKKSTFVVFYINSDPRARLAFQTSEIKGEGRRQGGGRRERERSVADGER